MIYRTGSAWCMQPTSFARMPLVNQAVSIKHEPWITYQSQLSEDPSMPEIVDMCTCDESVLSPLYNLMSILCDVFLKQDNPSESKNES
ncbi:hypothetical protein ACJMK2_025384 [Sinanodonta woodiana]|uniref:Uncharacterized protein n=1 Tax=Sinanodonta woodiana TaxID=1069815 RepID=A0ABD3XGB0_SINWO